MNNWNPWHGCIKYSEGCQNCFVFSTDTRYGRQPSDIHKTAAYDLPIKLNREKQYKLNPPDKTVATCFTSDFFIDKADEWRKECWKMIKTRQDLYFLILTKRVLRIEKCLPDDWGEGYDNVIISATVENQHQADLRLPVFNELPLKHKMITCAPLLGAMDLTEYLNPSVEQVTVSGESALKARICKYEWVTDLQKQCIAADIPFHFMHTGSRFEKDGKIYHIKKAYQSTQAHKANLDYKYYRKG